MALAVSCSLADPGILVAVLTRDVALMLFGRVLRLVYRDDAFVVKHFPPRCFQPTADGLEDFDHGEIHGLGHMLRGRSPLCGDLKIERLRLSGNGGSHHRLADAVFFGCGFNPGIEFRSGARAGFLVIIPDELLDARR